MGFFSRLFSRQKNPSNNKPAPVVRASLPRRADARVVPLDNTALHIKRGWKQEGSTYRGYYRTKHGAWKGEITRRGDQFDVFILKPPVSEIQRHPRWVCFHEREKGKYQIRLAMNPRGRDIDSIIFYVEKVIYESHAM